MKKLFLFLMMSSMTLLPLTVLADDGDDVPIEGGQTSSTRPKLPARRLITATYENCQIHFSINASLIPALISVTNEDTNEVWTVTATQTTETVVVSGNPGTYNIEIVVNDNLFTGTFTHQ